MISVESRLLNRDDLVRCFTWIRDNNQDTFIISIYEKVNGDPPYSYVYTISTNEALNLLVGTGLPGQYYIIFQSNDLKTLSLYKLIWT